VRPASAVALSGLIGFVGLFVPHVMRLIVTGTAMMPSSALLGAAFWSHRLLARSPMPPTEIPWAF
jgi:iron complex transport system permease protein